MASRLPIDSLALFARFSREQCISLRDPKASQQFTNSVEADVAKALDNDALLHGQRTQNMFESMIISLGKYKLMKLEDVGTVYPTGTYVAPDFRLILSDGTQWLVEVKNVYSTNPHNQTLKLREKDVAKIQAYADAVDCPLKYAIYWSRWRMWTLVDLCDFDMSGSKRSIKMRDAFPLSELGKVGDRAIGTEPPLTLRLMVDKSKVNVVAANGEVRFTIASVKMFSQSREIANSVEQEIAWIFMNYGDWQCSEPTAKISDSKLEYIEFIWTPRERSNPDQNFEMIGSLSSMFSRYYAYQTIEHDKIVQLEAEPVPDWFKPLIDSSHKRDALPLWRFELQANHAL